MLKLAIAAKGRLQHATVQWFNQRGIVLSYHPAQREYCGTISGINNADLVLLSAADIPAQLHDGRVHLGVTGLDLICEQLIMPERRVVRLLKMEFGFANLLIAVPKVWIDVSCLEDLDEVAAQFRKNHGFRIRIATKYHNLVREFLQSKGIANYQLIDSQGATEGSVKNLIAELIADITSSGETLQANHLKALDDGVILKSQAGLYASQSAQWDDVSHRTLQELCLKIGCKPLIL